MKKTEMTIIAIACLMVISLSTFAPSYIQATESMSIKDERNADETNAQSDDSINPQTSNSNIQQALESDVAGKIDKVVDSSKIEDEQTLSQHEFIGRPNETSHSQISDLPTPLPDGRIFLRSSAGTEDPIPYIPTENPKITSRTPIVPLELDN